MSENDDFPREKRNSVIVRALVMAVGIAPAERRVRNLSRSGACLEHDGTLKAGMTVLMQMGALQDLAAEVMWVTDRLAGVRFAQDVDLDAARKPRGVATVPRAGWIVDADDPYRR